MATATKPPGRCSRARRADAQAAVEAVVNRNMEGDVTFTCFDIGRLERVRGMGDDLLIGAILPDPDAAQIDRALELGAAGIGIHYRNLCLRQVEQVRDQGLDLRAWNPDTLETQRAMIGLGVTGVSTNRPDILVDYLRNQRENPL